MHANTIDEAIEHLEAIKQTLKDGNPMGYFARLYHKVTIIVKEGKQKKVQLNESVPNSCSSIFSRIAFFLFSKTPLKKSYANE